jgi:hypothetical protein
MRDSRSALLQNETVQRLTYLTIGYLPMALMAVSNGPNVPESRG